MTAGVAISASLEDYLEAIYQIISQKSAARPRDIAKRLKITYPSVTGALKLLAEKGLINYSPYDIITLTEEGKSIAQDVIRRHEILRDFLVEVLAVPHDDADRAACQMEHSIPKELVERFVRFFEFIRSCPRGGSKWIKGFSHHCDKDSQRNCEPCILSCLEDLRERFYQMESGKQGTAQLSEIKPGTKCRVLELHCEGVAKKRLLEMGVTPGSVAEVERVAPLGDPIDIKIRGYHLSLRREDAEKIEVEVL